jgi:hypothetical protein
MASSRVTGDMRSLPFLLAASVVFTCGCSSAPAVTRAQAVSTHRQIWRPAARASQQRAAAPASRYLPGTIHAVPMRPGSPPGVVSIPAGTAVSAADIGARAATAGHVVFGLADQGTDFGEVWPAISTDSGKRWRIDGPLFFYAAANAAAGTDRIGARNGDMAWAWGWGGTFVKVTADRGRHWLLADFPAGVDTVTWQDGQLYVRALGHQTATGQFQTFLYISPDNGRTWTLRSRLSDISVS